MPFFWLSLSCSTPGCHLADLAKDEGLSSNSCQHKLSFLSLYVLRNPAHLLSLTLPQASLKVFCGYRRPHWGFSPHKEWTPCRTVLVPARYSQGRQALGDRRTLPFEGTMQGQL